jgi:hypothetical protein
VSCCHRRGPGSHFYYMHSNILEWASVHSKKKRSKQLSTPKKLEWAVVHSKILTFFKWNVVYSNFFGVEFECTPNFLEWTWSALQKFWSGLEVNFKTFGVDLRCTPNFLLQGSENFWSGKVSTPNILEQTASHSKKIGVHTFSLQIGVHEVKSWSVFSLSHLFSTSGCGHPQKRVFEVTLW